MDCYRLDSYCLGSYNLIATVWIVTVQGTIATVWIVTVQGTIATVWIVTVQGTI